MTTKQLRERPVFAGCTAALEAALAPLGALLEK